MAAATVTRRVLLISQNAAVNRLRPHDRCRNWGPRSYQSGSGRESGLFMFGGGGEVSARRSLTSSARLQSSKDKVTVDFINRDGDKLQAEGNLGDSLLDVVIDNNLDIDGFGACEGTLACSTCHLIFEESIYKKLDCVTDEEMDMLDLSYGLTETSRLGCQICLKKWMDGMTVEVPSDVADARQTKDIGSCT